ncbi:MAG: single-stranded DNA-binding protein [Phycisphaeraceae bacterium]|nr:single-stranded DNA-binding protein [Phycisphaeraceae bacterium]
MAGSFNKVFLMGNLTRDVEMRHTPQNTAVGSFGLAVNRKYRTQDGQNHEEVTFVDCEAWGRTAEVMAQYLKKGRPAFIEGRLKLDQWQDQQGNKRSRLKVVVENFQFVDSGQGGGGGGHSSGGGGGAGSGGGGSSYSGGNYDSDPIPPDDDIPF